MTVADQQPAVRYLVRIEELNAGYAKARLLHLVANHSMDLKPLDSVVTIAVAPEAFDDLLALNSRGVPALIDIEGGQVVRAATTEEAGVRPAQKVVLRLEEGLLNTYAVIYTAKEYFEPLKRSLLSMTYHWAHELKGRKHRLQVREGVQFVSHCPECVQVRTLRRVSCPECTSAGQTWLWKVQPDLLAMIKLAYGNTRSSGGFTTQVDGQGRLQIRTKATTLSTDVYEIQGLLERAVAGGS